MILIRSLLLSFCMCVVFANRHVRASRSQVLAPNTSAKKRQGRRGGAFTEAVVAKGRATPLERHSNSLLLKDDDDDHGTACAHHVMVSLGNKRRMFAPGALPVSLGKMLIPADEDGNVCYYEYRLVCMKGVSSVEKVANKKIWGISTFAGRVANIFGAAADQEAVEERTICMDDKPVTRLLQDAVIKDVEDDASAIGKIERSGVFVGSSHVKEFKELRLQVTDPRVGLSVSIDRVPQSVATLKHQLTEVLAENRRLQKALKQCNADLESKSSDSEAEDRKIQFWIKEQAKQQEELDKLKASGYEDLQKSVKELRATAGSLEVEASTLRLAQSGGALAPLTARKSALKNFIYNWEPGKAKPAENGDGSSSAVKVDPSKFPENQAWPPAIPPLKQAAESPSDAERLRNEQLKRQVLKMESMIATLKAAKADVNVQLGKLQKQIKELAPLAQAGTQKAKALNSEVAALEQAANNGFPEGYYKIRRLDLIASRGSEVTTLLDQLLQNLEDPAKKQRFEEFSQRGLVDRTKMEFDMQHLNGLQSHYALADYQAVWRHLDGLVGAQKSLWQAAFDAKVSPDRVSPQPTAAFIEAENLLGSSSTSLFDHWLIKSPLAFNENLLDEYLNWVEDINGAVRVYIKVTNRERTTEGRKASNAILACANPDDDGLEYAPDRKVRLLPCDKPPAKLTCMEAKASSDALDYGPYYGIFASGDSPQQRDMVLNNPKNKEDVYESTKTWAPGLNHVLHQVKSGYTVVLFGYGYSGSGKTYTLLGSGGTQGVVTVGLQDLGANLESVTVRVKELYGQMKLEDGRPFSGETGIYSYHLESDGNSGLKTIPCEGNSSARCLETDFWGRHPTEETTPAMGVDVSPTGFKDHLEKDRLVLDKENIGTFLNNMFELVKDTRIHAKCRTSDRACPRVRATPNNPESSRGHLFTILDVKSKGSERSGSIVVVDMAGAENPLAIAKDYVDYSVLGWNDTKIDEYVGKKLKVFDKPYLSKYKLWHTIAGDDFKINRANAEAFLGSERTKEIKKRAGRDPDGKVLDAWVREHIEPTLIPMMQEGVFVNEGLNHLRQFLLARGGKIDSLTQNIETFPWEINDDSVTYSPQKYIQPSEQMRVMSEGRVYSTKQNRGRVPMIVSGECVVEWRDECADMVVDGFMIDPHRRTDRQQKMSLEDVRNGEVTKIDPMLMLSMLNYFDHPEFFETATAGKVDMGRLPTKFVMIAAVRREHSLEESDPPKKTDQTAHQYKELKANICRGSKRTLEFTASLNPLASAR